MIWLVLAFLTGAAVLAVLAPLAGKSTPVDPTAADRAFYAEQIAEIERERAEGRLAAEDAEAARVEAARRLLRAGEAQSRAGEPGSRRTRTIVALAALAAIPALAVPIYLKVGAVGLSDMPLAARLEKTAPHSDLSLAVAKIEAHLAEHPDDGVGYEVVAPYYLRTGRFEDAIYALSEALRLRGATPTRYDALGETYVMAAQGEVTPAARGNFEAALALEAGDPMARYYLALAAAQDGDSAKAKELWTKLLEDAPPDAGYRDIVRGQLEKLDGEGPASEAGKAVAALPKGERQAAIRTMVERLAGRLAQKGDDVEGWLKLLRAYSVLSEPQKAGAALEGARQALKGKSTELARVEALAAELKIERKSQE